MAVTAYQALLQLYAEGKEQFTIGQIAQLEIELAIARAAILALEASLMNQDGEPYDLAALMAAYETAEAALGRNSALLSAGQIAAAQSLLQAIATVIAGLTA